VRDYLHLHEDLEASRPEMSSVESPLPRPNVVLFTPGPVRVPPIVAEYLASPPCNYHRQDAFRAMFAETEADLKALIGIRDPNAYFATHITSTGTGANEACLLAMEGLGKGLIIRNGFFAARAVDQAEQNRIEHAVLDAPHDLPVDPAEVQSALERDSAIKWAFYVSHETRTGLKNPMIEIGEVCKERGVKVAADVISSAWAYPIDLEGAHVDIALASSAKALMAAPGIGVAFMRRDFAEAIKPTQKRRGYYLDVIAEYEKQSQEMQPRFAQPVVLHAAMRAACIHLKKVGIDAHMKRIRTQMKEISDHLHGFGISPMLDAAVRSSVPSAISPPTTWAGSSARSPRSSLPDRQLPPLSARIRHDLGEILTRRRSSR